MAREETTGGVVDAGEELKLESRKPKITRRAAFAPTDTLAPLSPPDVVLDDLNEGDAILAESASAAKSFGSQVDVLTSQGTPLADAIRSIGVTEVTYYRWRNEYGGLKSDQVKRLKDLETENARLRQAISDLTLDKQILQEAARGNY